MADQDQVFLDEVEKAPSKEEGSPTADQIIANGEETKTKPTETVDNLEMNVKVDVNTDTENSKEKESEEEEKEQKRSSSCSKEDDDTKLIQNESGTLLSRGDEFEAEPNQTDSVLNDIQTNSDIRFFICGSCKYNPILIGSVPKLLPCLHSFCENCLQERYETQKEASDETGVTPRLKCPSCGQEFLVAGNDKPTSAFLNNQFVIESTPKSKDIKEQQEDHQCTSCDDKSVASSYCMNCNEWLCDACVNAHQRVKVTKDHIIQSKSDPNSDQSQPAESPQTENNVETNIKHKPLYCKIHPQEQLKLFCANCEKLTCRDCQLIEHKDHRYQFIDEAATKHREILKKLLQYLQINLGLLKDTIGDVEKVSDGLSMQEKDIENEINKAFNGLILSIKTRQEMLIKELQTLVVSKQVMLNKQKKDLTQMKVILEHNHDFAEFAVKGGSNVALLYSRKVLGTRLHNLNSLKYRQRPLACLDLKFNLDVDKLCSYFGKVGSVYSQEDVQRKIDHFNTKANNLNNSVGAPRTMVLSSSRFSQSGQKSNPIESMSAINKRITDPSQLGTKYINLSKQGSLGLSGHQMVRAALSSVSSNTVNHQRSVNAATSAGQEMIVLSSPHSSRNPYLVQSDGKIVKNVSRYATHYPSNRDQYPSSRDHQSRDPARASPKTPFENKGFQFHHHGHSKQSRDYSRNSSLSSPMAEQPNIHWPKVSNEHSLAHPTNNTNMDQLRRMVQGGGGQMLKKPSESTSSSVPRSSSTRSNGSDGSAHSGQLLLDGMVMVKQEGQSPDGNQTFTNMAGEKQSNQDDIRSESGFDEGQNEDYCGVCRNGGELLCCDTCPKVYHLHCHIPPLSALPSDSWSCCLCADIGLETNTGVGSKRKYSDGMTEWELKLCRKLLLNLFVHVDSLPFHHKVSKVQVPDYYKVITRPMDFNTVLTKLATQHFEHYQNLESFIVDIRLVFSNCFVYNSAESEVCKMGRRLEEYFDKLLRKFVPHENHYPDTEVNLKRTRKEDSGVF